MNEIIYAVGDATLPMNSAPGIIAHVCNDIGQWGKGFVLPLGKRYPEAEKQYREWYKRNDPPFALGRVQFVEVAPELWVANMMGSAASPAAAPCRRFAMRPFGNACAVSARSRWTQGVCPDASHRLRPSGRHMG